MKTLLHYLLKETFVIFATVKSTTTLLFSFAPSGSDNAFENQVNIKPLSSNQIRRMFLFAVFLFTTSNMVGQVTITTATGGTNISADKAGNASVPTYSTLGNIVITESSSAKNEFQPGIEKEGWDGRSRDQRKLNPGVYVFVTEIIDQGISYKYFGEVTLIQ